MRNTGKSSGSPAVSGGPGSVKSLTEALAAKSRLLATVSHELRTPMGAMISMAELLLNTPLGDTQRHYATTLKDSAFSLLAILNDILDHSKLEAGQFTLTEEDFSPAAMLHQLRDALAPHAAASGLSMAVNIEGRLPDHVRGDPARIRQVLMNFANNAIKFTEHGGVTLHLTASGRKGGDPVLRFAVADSGPGFDRETRERLFRPFVQGSNDIAGKHGGTGLGLSIAASLIEAMGGRIGCDSTPGEGSRFWFEIPCARSGKATGDVADNDRGIQIAALPGDAIARVLVVDDNKINQMLIATYLQSFGHQFTIASNGEEAVAAAAKGDFDVVLMDIQMPGMDGIEATSRIRALGGPAGAVPVVALTANAMSGDEERYLAQGMDGYISKPIVAADLYRTIATCLNSAVRPPRKAEAG